jgi:hypothetical protein
VDIPWRWRQYVSPKRSYLLIKSTSVSAQKTIIYTFTAVRTTDLFTSKKLSILCIKLYKCPIFRFTKSGLDAEFFVEEHGILSRVLRVEPGGHKVFLDRFSPWYFSIFLLKILLPAHPSPSWDWRYRTLPLAPWCLGVHLWPEHCTADSKGVGCFSWGGCVLLYRQSDSAARSAHSPVVQLLFERKVSAWKCCMTTCSHPAGWGLRSRRALSCLQLSAHTFYLIGYAVSQCMKDHWKRKSRQTFILFVFHRVSWASAVIMNTPPVVRSYHLDKLDVDGLNSSGRGGV